jgi:predicted transcriptional regulator
MIHHIALQLQRMGNVMKTASLPSLRVDPELRAAAESVLKEGESLSSLIEDSLRRQIDYRKTQAEFIARGLAGLANAERTGVFYTTDDIQELMRKKLEKAKARKAAQQK